MPMKLALSTKVLKIVNDQNAISMIDSIVDDWLCRFNAAMHQTSSSAGEAPAGFALFFVVALVDCIELLVGFWSKNF